MTDLFRFDRKDPDDLEDFVRWLFDKCLWVFFVGASIIIVAAIFGAGDGGLPPEPQKWIEFRAVLVAWL